MPNKISVPSIVWQKWNDPFLDNGSTHMTPEDFIQEPEYIDDINISESEDIDEENDSDNQEKTVNKKHFKAILTPFGIMPYDDYHSISRSFNFWIGHTNFDISNPIATLIESSSGVETLDIFTRYRFRIGIAQLFNSGDVMSSITNNIYKYLDTYGE